MYICEVHPAVQVPLTATSVLQHINWYHSQFEGVGGCHLQT